MASAAGVSFFGCSPFIFEGPGADEISRQDARYDEYGENEDHQGHEVQEKKYQPEGRPEPAELKEPAAEKGPVAEKKPAGIDKGALGSIPRRPLGDTGINTSLLGLGGAFTIARPGRADDAAEIIRRAVDLGVNYIDTAPTYQESETNIGLALGHDRGKVILASKTLDRTYDGTMRLFERSLARLKTDYLDIYQLHGVHTREELNSILAPGGALKAVERLKDEGLIRHIGITGHKSPEILRQALEEYHFDCLLLTLNAGDIYYESFQKGLVCAAQERDIGIIAMKVAAYGRIFREGGITSMEQALGYVLSLPVSCAIIGISKLEELEENINIVKDFAPYTRQQMDQVERLVGSYWQDVNFFKTEW